MTAHEAIDALYGASFKGFVTERKRLAAELKAAGDAAGAKAVAALPRPSVSAWAVNQLWRQDREGLEALFESAARLRGGDFDASGEHREVLEGLKKKAGELLAEDGNGVSDAVLRRVTMTLQALAAVGGFEPDVPGQLTVDRDPPGFEALAGMSLPAAPARKPPDPARLVAERKAEVEAVRERKAREEAEAEKKAAERAAIEARAAKAAERKRLTAELASAERALARVSAEVVATRKALEQAELDEQEAAAKVEERRAALDALAD